MASVVLKCVVCGREFESPRRDRLACSPACYAIRRVELKRARTPGRPPVRRCAVCKQEFEPRTGAQRFCSIRCRLAAGYAATTSLSKLVTRWSDPPDAKTLARAKERPPWCSPARWRIELARRRDPERYALSWDGYPVHGGGAR